MVTAPTQIHLIRHGEVHNPRQILYGRLPRFRLSDAGRRQAEATAHWFKGRPVAALFSSPMLRARQTAQAFADRYPRLRIEISAWLNEVYSSYEGWPGATIDARGGDVYTGSGDCFEQPYDIVERVRKFTARTRARFTGRQVVAITHLPQVASMGSDHFIVFKEDTDDATYTRIRKLEAEERVTEVARMLSGEEVTEAALSNARVLLKV